MTTKTIDYSMFVLGAALGVSAAPTCPEKAELN